MITLKVNGAEFSRQLDDVARQQLPFALANTLTSIGWEGVEASKEKLPGRFTIRNGWVAQGYRVKKAVKKNLIAVVSHKDKYMLLQEQGGQKTPNPTRPKATVSSRRKGPSIGPAVTIPVGARPSPSSTTPPSMWPGKIKHGFNVKKGDMILVFERFAYTKKGKLRKTKRNRALAALPHRGKDPDVRLMDVLKKTVPVKPRLHLADDIKKVISTRLGFLFNREMANAIRTAKPR